MPRIGTLLFGIILGAGLMFGAQRYHVLRTDKGVELVPKLSSGLSETYVDVRNFTPSDWAKHRTLAAAVMKADKNHIFKEGSVDQLRQGLESALQSLMPSERGSS